MANVMLLGTHSSLCTTKTRAEGIEQSYVNALYRHGNPVTIVVGFLQLLERGKRARNIAGSLENFSNINTKGMQDIERKALLKTASLFHTDQITFAIVMRVLSRRHYDLK